jgi:hypothetical protein
MNAIKGSPNSSYLMMLRKNTAMTSKAIIIRENLIILEIWINVREWYEKL